MDFYMFLGSSIASALRAWDLTSTCDWAQMTCVFVQQMHGFCGKLFFLVRDVVILVRFDNLDRINPEIFEEWNLQSIDFYFLNIERVYTAG